MKLSKFAMCLDPRRQAGEDFDAYKERRARLTRMSEEAGRRGQVLFQSTAQVKGKDGKMHTVGQTAVNMQNRRPEDMVVRKQFRTDPLTAAIQQASQPGGKK